MDTIPQELVVLCMEYCDIRSVLSFTRTCNKYRFLLYDKPFCLGVIYRHYGISNITNFISLNETMECIWKLCNYKFDYINEPNYNFIKLILSFLDSPRFFISIITRLSEINHHNNFYYGFVKYMHIDNISIYIIEELYREASTRKHNKNVYEVLKQILYSTTIKENLVKYVEYCNNLPNNMCVFKNHIQYLYVKSF
jgi:hypothetical protein